MQSIKRKPNSMTHQPNTTTEKGSMKKFRFWIAKKLLHISWFISPNRTAMQRMNDYASVYGIGMSVVNPRDIYLDPKD